MSYIITLNGKGGSGKTTLTALILDEVLRAQDGRGNGGVLVVDADPAQTLHLALGIPSPQATVATLADTVRFDAGTMRALPVGTSRVDYVRDQMAARGVLTRCELRGARFDYLALGQRREQGCYCAINHVLKGVLSQLADGYSLVLIDNEAGLEHLNRHRLTRADLFLVVVTPNRASLAVGERAIVTAREMGMTIEDVKVVVNGGTREHLAQISPFWRNGAPSLWATVPRHNDLRTLELEDEPVVLLPDVHPVRQALQPAIDALPHHVP